MASRSVGGHARHKQSILRLESGREDVASLRAAYPPFGVQRAADELRRLVGGRSTAFVGSGGASAVARFAADTHTHRTGRLGLSVTPLGLAGGVIPRDSAAVVITARASHPDVGLALSGARGAGMSPVVLLTHRDRSELGAVQDLATDVISLPLRGGREGFLATRSVLSLAAVFAATVGPIPKRLPSLTDRPSVLISRSRTLILHGPRTAPVATDLETRLSELGATSVQVADFRSFAHGRHYGFSRNLAETLVVAIVEPSDEALARRTISLLPSESLIQTLQTELEWPNAVLDLLPRSIALASNISANEGIDSRRPRVPSFGRRLYHLSAQRLIPTRELGPVQRKLDALGRPGVAAYRDRYERALVDWLDLAAQSALGAVVLDYDGTVCTTRGRFDLPSLGIRELLIDLLDHGLLVGFASGRGKSLHRDLRKWVPPGLRNRVTVGLYNGAVVQSLEEPVSRDLPKSPAISGLGIRLAGSILDESVHVAERASQISLSWDDERDVESVTAAVADLMIRDVPLPLRIVRSAHSLDIIPLEVTKSRVVERVQSLVGGAAILCIGDQGQSGGNDHEMLAHVPLTLSVDRCSADPTRCWNLDRTGILGPNLLSRYLTSIRKSRGSLLFRWRNA